MLCKAMALPSDERARTFRWRRRRVTHDSNGDLLKIELHWGIRIPLRDGVTLNATLYSPRDQPQPLPCVCSLTPYISDTYHGRGMYFATHGLPFLIVDVRGRGNSDGDFRPFIQEAQDGFDVIEWLAQQPYCNGKVAMWGGSYAGYAQWAAAKERPPHLFTLVPSAAPYFGVDFPMRNNIFYPFLVQWLTLTAGRALQAQIFSDRAFWSASYRHWHESGRRFRDLDAVTGHPCPVFQEWLSYPELGPYWDAYNPSAAEYAQLQIPILTLTGSYDDTQSSALRHYREHMRNTPADGRARHYLVIGPWNHAGTGAPSVAFGGIECGAAALLDLAKLTREWYGWTLQGGPKPEFLKAPVAYYVMGAECWRYAQTLEEATSHHDIYFLNSAGNADDVFSAGSLGSVPCPGPPDCYTFDPADCKGLEIDAEERADALSLVDQAVTLALRGKQLIYTSAPFEKDTEITGFFKLSAWLSIDCPDTDFYVSVHEISQSGTSIRLSTDAIRARYRESLHTPKLVPPGELLGYVFERFTFISRVVRRGTRLRLVIAPMGRLVETTFAEKNYNAGGIVAEESAMDSRPVTVTLYHNATHPSTLQVPIGRADP